MSKPSIALVIVDTDLHALASAALRHSLLAFPCQQVLIFSDRTEPWQGLPVVLVPVLRNIGDYNRLITRGLAEHLRADVALVIQYDGFVLNATQYSPHFEHYDYIGAPWPQFKQHAVGNGGFSWRSRRLVEAVARLPYDDPTEAEDLFICRRMRPTLEAQGLRFAPVGLASHFSVEYPAVPYPTFGFHGIFLLPQVYRHMPDFLVDNLSDRVVQTRSNFLLPSLDHISPGAAQRLRERLAHLGPVPSPETFRSPS